MKALYALAIAGLASGLCLVLIIILAGRDSSQVQQGAAAGPGKLEQETPAGQPPTSGRYRSAPIEADRTELSDDQILTALADGNVVIVYEGSDAPSAVQEDVSGPFDPELAAAGQAVILAQRAGVGPPQALAWKRRLVASGPDDPQLQEFAEAWLGQGSD